MPSAVSAARLTPKAKLASVTPDRLKALDASGDIERDGIAVCSPNIVDTRDVRAWEHNRQRMKKIEDVAKMKARKGQGRTTKFHDSKKGLGVAGRPCAMDDLHWTRDEDLESVDVPAPGDTGKFLMGESCLPDARFEINLADLVRFAGPRKGQNGEFEVVPPIRSVIVLDDVVTCDVGIDESWERIDGADNRVTDRGPSYAAVVSLK